MSVLTKTQAKRVKGHVSPQGDVIALPTQHGTIQRTHKTQPTEKLDVVPNTPQQSARCAQGLCFGGLGHNAEMDYGLSSALCERFVNRSDGDFSDAVYIALLFHTR